MSSSHECWFDHEKLEVYREAIAFMAWLSGILENAVRVGDVKDQLDRASTSVPMNIAEGNGKYAPKVQTVGEFVYFMTQNGLHFAPATPGDQSAYTALHRALAAYDFAVQSPVAEKR